MIAEIVFAAGCFWGVEKKFENMEGVVDVQSGYSGGNYTSPTYKKVLQYRKQKDEKIINHTESVLVKFDTDLVTSEELIKAFWQMHDPTQLNRQGNDIGNNYRSAIFYTNDKQKNIALETKNAYQVLLNAKGYGNIVTQIQPLSKFWPAEEYHQDYLKRNPYGYCPDHSTGVKFMDQPKKEVKSTKVKPLGGKEILVIESEGFCPYCEKFKEEVSSQYKGTLPLRTVYAKDLEKFSITTKLNATPTILFLEEGKELFSYRGYMDAQKFYEALGAFKLGESSKAYRVAFKEGTDARYCQQYEIFKNTPDGVFIDKLSGDILFDTKDRFNSGSGWLSFYKAVDGATEEKLDLSYGMIRTEVIAKKSGIHLGHVFDEEDKFDGEKYRRFCINATVLEFVPRAEIKK
jgi:peptide methionine sulfoxide reductase msrA/msrB